MGVHICPVSFFELCIGFSEETERVSKFEIKDKNGVKDLKDIYTNNNLLELERIIIDNKSVEIRFYSIKKTGKQFYLDVLFKNNGSYALVENEYKNKI